MPKISIIMPNCNYAQYLTAALDSVLAQTFQDWECIVIDDGSRDDSVSIIRRYMAKDKRIRLIGLSEPCCYVKGGHNWWRRTKCI